MKDIGQTANETILLSLPAETEKDVKMQESIIGAKDELANL